jgi:2-amino-4-hydroxy-6-hydroxymethyldihydropteridine diphosphokinase
MSVLALISLGSNLGDRKANLDKAIAELGKAEGVAVRAVSSYHETRPVGGPEGQEKFLNSGAVLEITLDSLSLLHRLQEIEALLGRVRSVHWGERTLDLDLVLFGGQTINRSELKVPHPRFSLRRFVLAPLAEIAPEMKDPLTGCSMEELLANLDRRPSCLALYGWWTQPERTSLYRRIVHELWGTSLSARERLDLGDQRDPLLTLRMEPQRLLEQMARWLDRERWKELGVQWLITDFALRELATNATVHWAKENDMRLAFFIAQLEKLERSLVKPTFVVRDPHMTSGLNTGYSCKGTPCLQLEATTEDEQVSEIRWACVSTRS